MCDLAAPRFSLLRAQHLGTQLILYLQRQKRCRDIGPQIDMAHSTSSTNNDRCATILMCRESQPPFFHCGLIVKLMPFKIKA
jgi:hypothetical protein